MDGGDWGVFLDEYGVLELSPVPAFCAMFGGYSAWVPLHDHGLIVHCSSRDKRWTSASTTKRGSAQEKLTISRAHSFPVAWRATSTFRVVVGAIAACITS